MTDRYSQEPRPLLLTAKPLRRAVSGRTMSGLLRLWIPLALSWVLMTAGMPVVTAVLARMREPDLQLASLGISHSVTMAVQSPVIALLTASVALAKDRTSLRLLKRFTVVQVVLCTLIMAVLAYRPTFDLVIVDLMGTPPEVARLVRPSLLAFTLFPAGVAYRRFLQGLIIQRGSTSQVTYGALIRLATTVGLVLLGFRLGRWDGALVAATAMTAGILVEALYTHLVARQSVRLVEENQVSSAIATLTVPNLLQFYWPLAITSMVWLWAPSLINFGLTRAPFPVQSLAVWPVVSAQVVLVSSLGFSLMEVVVAVLKDPRAVVTVRRFSLILCAASLAILYPLAFTPLATSWLQVVAGLNPELTAFAIPALRWSILLPLIAVVQSWFRGLIVAGESTSSIAQATMINVAIMVVVLLMGAAGKWMMGASLAAVALTISRIVEVGWLWRWASPVQRRLGEKARAAGPCT